MVVDVLWCLVLLVWSLALRAPGAVCGDDWWRFSFFCLKVLIGAVGSLLGLKRLLPSHGPSVIFVAVFFGFKNVFIILTVIAYYNRYIARYMEKIAATQYLYFDAFAASSGNVSSMDFSHILECRLIYLSYKNCIKIRQIFLRYISCWEEVTVSFLEIKVTQ